jgi:hypothetical protein
MSEILKEVPQQTTLAIVKEQRAREAAQAMQEYEAGRLAIQARSERLRALRLANAPVVEPVKVKKRAVAVKRAR